MEAVATTSEHMGSVLQQLQEAFTCSEIDESSRQEVIQERSQDLMDACLTELLRCVATQKIKVEVCAGGEESCVERCRLTKSEFWRQTLGGGQLRVDVGWDNYWDILFIIHPFM